LFHADRRTDRQNEIVPFRNFANAPKNISMSAVVLQLKVLQQFLPFVFRIKAVKQHNRSGDSTVFGLVEVRNRYVDLCVHACVGLCCTTKIDYYSLQPPLFHTLALYQQC